MQSTNTVTKTAQASKTRFLSTRNLVLIGMFAAVLAVISQISVPMPGGVPITIQLFGVTLVGAVLGWKRGVLSTIVYILLGAIGLPIFANFQGGVHVIAGMAGGYIIAWPILAIMAGIRPKSESKKASWVITIVLTVVGVLIDEFIGGLQWALLSSERTLGAIMAYSFVAFIPKDIIISILAQILGQQIRRILMNNHLMDEV